MQQPIFPNGFDSWYETYFEITEFMLNARENNTPGVIERTCLAYGRTALAQLACAWTNEFEALHQGREWDGEFFEEVDAFCEKQNGNPFRYVPALFNIEGPDFAGYHDPERRWNGWANPKFERPEAEKVAAWINGEPEPNRVNAAHWEGDTLVVREMYDTEEEEAHRIEPMEIEVAGEKKTVWAIGNYSWTWWDSPREV